MSDAPIETAASLRSGKGATDENFPVASHLIAARHRPAILAFYDFVRTADDVADHATLAPADKLRLLDRLEASLLGRPLPGGGPDEPAALALRRVLDTRGLSPRHAQDLLAAFRLDVTKPRYASWDELIDYCRLSAMPVGRYVLDVHGESQATWPANDALCAALQIVNHIQDCGEDRRMLNRVYLPLDALEAAGARVEDLDAPRASPALRACLHVLAGRTAGLLHDADGFASSIASLRLALEVAVIHRLAMVLNQGLMVRDPLSEPVHLGKAGAAMVALRGVLGGLARRMLGPGGKAAA